MTVEKTKPKVIRSVRGTGKKGKLILQVGYPRPLAHTPHYPRFLTGTIPSIEPTWKGTTTTRARGDRGRSGMGSGENSEE